MRVCVCAQSLSCVQLFEILWSIVCQAPLSMGFSRQECWSRLPCPLLGHLPDPRMEPAVAAKSLQSCPTLCEPIDGSPPSSPIPGILQARTLEWVAISFSNASKWKVKVKSLSCVRLFETPQTAAYQAPPSMGFSRQENWSGVPLPSPRNLLICISWITGGFFTIESPGKPLRVWPQTNRISHSSWTCEWGTLSGPNRYTESETLGMGPSNLCFNLPSRWFWCTPLIY